MKNLTCFKIAAAAMLAAATSFGATTMRAGNAGGQEIPVSGPYSTMRFVWRQVKNGGEDLGWNLPLSKYARKGSSQGLCAIYSKYNKAEYLAESQLRLDGRIVVPKELAGTWQLSLAYDDYMYVIVDGRCRAKNPSFEEIVKANIEIAEGEHDISIVCGDTYGGYGEATCDQESAIMVSINGGAPMPFDDIFVYQDGTKEGSGATVWRHVKNGGERLDVNLPLSKYRLMGETEGLNPIYSEYNKEEHLSESQLRLDGWFNVDESNAGAWEFVQGYDDYMSFGIDGAWLLHNPTFTETRKVRVQNITPGRHRFTVVCGDTYGGFGEATCDLERAIMVSINGAKPIPFEDIVKGSSGKGVRTGNDDPGTGAGTTPPKSEPPAGEGPAVVKPSGDNGNQPATTGQKDPSTHPPANPPTATDPAGGGKDAGPKTGDKDADGGGEVQPGGGSGRRRPKGGDERKKPPSKVDSSIVNPSGKVEYVPPPGGKWDIKYPKDIDVRLSFYTQIGYWKVVDVKVFRVVPKNSKVKKCVATPTSLDCTWEETSGHVEWEPTWQSPRLYHSKYTERPYVAIPAKASPEYSGKIQCGDGKKGELPYEGPVVSLSLNRVAPRPKDFDFDALTDPVDFAEEFSFDAKVTNRVLRTVFCKQGGPSEKEEVTFSKTALIDEPFTRFAYAEKGNSDKQSYYLIEAHVGDVTSYVFYIYEYHDLEEETRGRWVLTETKIHKPDDQPPWRNKYSDRTKHVYEASQTTHSEFMEEWYYPNGSTEEGGKPVMRAKFTCYCDPPPASIKLGETVEMKVKVKMEDRWRLNPRFSGDLSGGACVGNSGMGCRLSTSFDRNLGKDGPPTEASAVCKYTAHKGRPGDQKPGQRDSIKFTGCGSTTEWIYEWTLDSDSGTKTGAARDGIPGQVPERNQQGEAMIKFAQNNMGLPANRDKFVIKSKDKKKNKVGLDEYRIPFVVLNMPTNRPYKVTAGFSRVGAAGENGRYLEANAITNAIPYSVDIVKDKEYGEKGVHDAVIKETGTYELPAGTNEGIILKVVAESGKPGEKDYVKIYETFPIFRIHLGLSLMLQANTIPCYFDMKETSKYKLDKQDIAGDAEKDPDEKYVIRQADFEVAKREGSLLLLLYDEDRADFVRIPAVPRATRVTAKRLTNDRYAREEDAKESHQEMVDALMITALSTGNKRDNNAHIINIAPTNSVLVAPIRFVADLEIDAIFGGRTYTAKKTVLLHSQPLRIIENADDERKYIEHDEHIKAQLMRISKKIEDTCIGRLFSVHNMIARMIEGYDYRFGYDEAQVKRIMETYVGFITGTFEGANGTPCTVNLGDEIKACYAFIQGLRDNTTFLGRMAMGVMSAGLSEFVFLPMTVLENMQNEIMTCEDVNKFDFWRAVQVGGEEVGKVVLIEIALRGAIAGAGKLAEKAGLDVQQTLQNFATGYRKGIDGMDAWLKNSSGIYRAGDKALQGTLNFFNSGSRAAAGAIKRATDSDAAMMERAKELLKKTRRKLTPDELAEVAKYEEAMANGMRKVRALKAAQDVMDKAAKGNDAAGFKAAKARYRKLADEVWTDKCALYQLQRVTHEAGPRMRAQFNRYRETLLDEIQQQAVKDVAAELGIPENELYVMNASNNAKADILSGKKVPGDRDITILRIINRADHSMDVAVKQKLGEETVALLLWRKLHGGKDPPSMQDALKFMQGKDVTYVNPYLQDGLYYEHNLDAYEDLAGMLGLKPDGSFDKSLLAKDLHNPVINQISIRHKGVEWFGTRASEKLAEAAAKEAQAAALSGAAKEALLKEAMDLRYRAVGDMCEGIRQIVKQTEKIIIARGIARTGGNPLPADLNEMHVLAMRVGQDVSPTEFAKVLRTKCNMSLFEWADAVSRYVNVKATLPGVIDFSPGVSGAVKKGIDDALDREKKKQQSGRR